MHIMSELNNNGNINFTFVKNLTGIKASKDSYLQHIIANDCQSEYPYLLTPICLLSICHNHRHNRENGSQFKYCTNCRDVCFLSTTTSSCTFTTTAEPILSNFAIIRFVVYELLISTENWTQFTNRSNQTFIILVIMFNTKDTLLYHVTLHVYSYVTPIEL